MVLQSKLQYKQTMSTTKTIGLDALTTIREASGEVKKNPDGTCYGALDLTTDNGNISLTLEQFDAIYRGFVTCWPAVSPLKAKVAATNREATKAIKDKQREDAKEAKRKEREAAKQKREEERTAAKKAKEDAAAKAKADREAKAKAEAEAKAKADKEKAKKAADAKAKADKATAKK